MDKNVISIAALGRQFQVGDFYNYPTDCVVKGGPNSLCEASILLDQFTRVENKFSFKIEYEATFNRWENFYLDNHLLMSVLCGLINNYKGASRFFNDQPNQSEASRILHFRVQSEEKHLNLKSFEKSIAKLAHDNREILDALIPAATHVVIGVIYGTEAYCALSNNLNDDTLTEDAREAAEDQLFKIANCLTRALKDGLSLCQFNCQFDEEERELPVRLYADGQAESFRKCDVSGVYKQLRKMIHVKNDAIPIVALLCPLKDVEAIGGNMGVLYEYRDINSKVVAPFCHLLFELDRVRAKVDSLYTTALEAKRSALSTSLQQFGDAIVKYKEMFVKNSLKFEVVKARRIDRINQEISDEDDCEIGDYGVVKILTLLENDPYFKPSDLERWLDEKIAEIEVDKKMMGIGGVAYLASIESLKEKLTEEGKALVLNVPPLDEWTNRIAEEMTNYVKKHTTNMTAGDSILDEDAGTQKAGNSWNTALAKRKQVLSKVNQFASHIQKNKKPDQVQFFIVLDKDCSNASYSVYENGHLLSEKCNRLPKL